MKIYIGKTPSWFGTYHVAEKILFWKDDNNDDDYGDIIKLRDLLDKIPGLNKFFHWIYNKRGRKVKVKIHDYDTWSVDDTLALIIHPLLVALKTSKQGGPAVDDDDVPDNLKRTSAKPIENPDSGALDEFWFDRWDYVLDEMIWAFDQTTKDWESQFYVKEDLDGPVDYKNLKFDREGLGKHSERMQNGYRLFGKYYQNLWS